MLDVYFAAVDLFLVVFFFLSLQSAKLAVPIFAVCRKSEVAVVL